MASNPDNGALSTISLSYRQREVLGLSLARVRYQMASDGFLTKSKRKEKLSIVETLLI